MAVLQSPGQSHEAAFPVRRGELIRLGGASWRMNSPLRSGKSAACDCPGDRSAAMPKFLRLGLKGFALLLRGCLEQPAMAAEEQCLALFGQPPGSPPRLD